MRFINNVLGYLFLVLGFLAVAMGGQEASGAGAICIAGAILIAAERIRDWVKR